MPAVATLPPQRPDVVLRPDLPKDKPPFNPTPKSNPTSTTLTTASTPSPKQTQKEKPKPTTCEGCSQPHDGSYGSGRFCSVHCARRIAASRKWEKQRSQRKRAAAAATTPSTTVDHSTSSLSSASSDDRATQKRQRVVVMPGMMHAPHVVHHSNLVHPQPQHYQRPLAFAGMLPRPCSASASPISATPTPPPSHHTLPPYMDYSNGAPRAVTPVQYHPGYYPYHTTPIPYTSTPPPYAIYPHPPHAHIPPPPPPTPAQDLLNYPCAPPPVSYAQNPVLTRQAHPVPRQGVVSSERECESVAEALLCLRTSSNTD